MPPLSDMLIRRYMSYITAHQQTTHCNNSVKFSEKHLHSEFFMILSMWFIFVFHQDYSLPYAFYFDFVFIFMASSCPNYIFYIVCVTYTIPLSPSMEMNHNTNVLQYF